MDSAVSKKKIGIKGKVTKILEKLPEIKT